MQGDVSQRVGGRGGSGRHYGWVGNSTPPYSTINYLLKVAGIYVMNNEETQECGLQFGAEEGGSSFCSAEHVLGGVGGSLHLIM